MKTHLLVHIPTLPDLPWPSRGPSLSFKTLHLTAELRLKLYPIIMSLCTQAAMQNFCTIRILVITWFPVAGQSSHYVSMDPSSLLKKTIYVLIFRCSCGWWQIPCLSLYVVEDFISLLSFHVVKFLCLRLFPVDFRQACWQYYPLDWSQVYCVVPRRTASWFAHAEAAWKPKHSNFCVFSHIVFVTLIKLQSKVVCWPWSQQRLVKSMKTDE